MAYNFIMIPINQNPNDSLYKLIKQYYLPLNSKLSSNAIIAANHIANSTLTVQKHILDGIISVRNTKQNQSNILNGSPISRTKSYINAQSLDLNDLSKTSNRSTILTDQQHHRLVAKFRKDRKQFTIKKLKHDEQTLRKAIQRTQKKQKQAKEQQLKYQESKRKKIKEKMEIDKAKRQKQIEIMKESHRKLLEVEKIKPLYQKMAERHNREVLLPKLEAKRQQLERISSMKALDLQKINNHEKEYLLWKQEKAESSKSISPPQKKFYYKSENLIRALERQQQETKNKLQEKKESLGKKIERQKLFSEYLKNFKPKKDCRKEREVQERIKFSSKPRLSRDHKTLGLSYLKDCKKSKLRTASTADNQPFACIKRKNKSDLELEIPGIKKEKGQKRIKEGQYFKKESIDGLGGQYKRKSVDRQRKLKNLVTDQRIDQITKIQRLKTEADLMCNESKRKERLAKLTGKTEIQNQSLELFLYSIRAKLSIIDICSEL